MASRSFAIALRIVVVSISALWLSGCGLPPAIAIMSSAANGISFIAAGKSFSDVALSAVTDQDCAVYRIVTEKEICRDADGHQRPAVVTVASARTRPAESFYMVRRDGQVLTATATELTARRARLEGFIQGTELYALVQDDGALEVFAHDPTNAGDGANMRLVVRISGYAAAPQSFRVLRINGADLAVEDIIV